MDTYSIANDEILEPSKHRSFLISLLFLFLSVLPDQEIIISNEGQLIAQVLTITANTGT